LLLIVLLQVASDCRFCLHRKDAINRPLITEYVRGAVKIKSACTKMKKAQPGGVLGLGFQSMLHSFIMNFMVGETFLCPTTTELKDIANALCEVFEGRLFQRGAGDGNKEKGTGTALSIRSWTLSTYMLIAGWHSWMRSHRSAYGVAVKLPTCRTLKFKGFSRAQA